MVCETSTEAVLACLCPGACLGPPATTRAVAEALEIGVGGRAETAHDNTQMLKRTIPPAALVLTGLLLLAGSAQAGRYHVYTCRTPAGEPAPTDGWVGSVALGGAF